MNTRCGYFALIPIIVAFFLACRADQQNGIVRVTHYDLTARLNTTAHRLVATATMAVETANRSDHGFLLLNRDFKITRLLFDGSETKYEFHPISTALLNSLQKTPDLETSLDQAAALVISLPATAKLTHEISIGYQGRVYDPPHVPKYLRSDEAIATNGVIGNEGIFLAPETHWYPHPVTYLAPHRVRTITLAGVETITDGESILHQTRGDSLENIWDAQQPADGLYLLGGRYTITERDLQDIKLYTYFLSNDSALAQQYLQHSARYIEMYSRLLSPYPYKKFAVVENFFPTGYGMPSYTVLGGTVLRLPFIVYTSLGHEILHNWWGNSVFVDYASGNWCEGLTLYGADYTYKEMQSSAAARQYRLELNRDYTLYVNADNDFPLTRFSNRTAMFTRTIGYGKSAMVFSMLRDLLGDDLFFTALRRLIAEKQFQRASWQDIERIFATTAGIDLTEFFTQWVEHAGAPQLAVADVTQQQTETAKYQLRFTLKQTQPVYSLNVPCLAILANDSMRFTVPLQQASAAISREFSSPVRELLIDPDYRLFRRLTDGEFSPIQNLVLGDPQQLVILPSHSDSTTLHAYQLLAEQLTRSGEAELCLDRDVTEAEFCTHALYLLGAAGENELVDRYLQNPSSPVKFLPHVLRLNGKTYDQDGNAFFVTLWNPDNRKKGLVVFAGFSAAAISSATSKLVHYGKYSYVIFDQGNAIDKGEWPVTSHPLIFRFAP